MTVTELSLPGLFKVELDVHSDDRGNFREAWQVEKMTALGLPEFQPVQQNISESKQGVLRGIHAEPWNKYIHMAFGTGFGAYIDLREDSPTFGQVETVELTQNVAIFIPKGLGNSYQVTSEWAAYSYLTDAHWKAGITYPAISYDDADLAISWPIPPIISEKDQKNPIMRQYYPHKFKN